MGRVGKICGGLKKYYPLCFGLRAYAVRLEALRVLGSR